MGSSGKGTDLADLHLPIKINGDLALFQAFGSLLVQWDALDHDFIGNTPSASTAGSATSAAIDWDLVEATTGLIPRRRSPRLRSCSATPTARCSAGRWA